MSQPVIENVYIKTYGCQMNLHDSERLRGILQAAGIGTVESPEQADLAIFNTCSVREKAEQKVYSDIGRLRSIKQARPQYRIAICGCIPQVQREALLQRAPLVDIVFGVNSIAGLMEYIQRSAEGPVVEVRDERDPAEYDQVSVQRDDPWRAFVTIMTGCDNFCSYCIVPYTRGREQSRSLSSILVEIEGLIADGVREITLLGQNVNSWRARDGELQVQFPDLLRRVHAYDELARIRFVTSHPKDFGDELIDAMLLPRICKYLHLPAQSGSNRILERMNRGYLVEEYLDRIGRLREAIPQIALSSDFLVGFPGETEADFAATLALLRAARYHQVFAFNYSRRPETAAARMPDQVPFEVSNRRLQELFALQSRISQEHPRYHPGQEVDVLIEGPTRYNAERYCGRTDTNRLVHFEAAPGAEGRMARIRLTHVKEHSLDGTLVSPC